MKKHLEQNQEPSNETSELIKKFDALDESGIAHSATTGELFKSGQEGEEKVVNKIEEIGTRHIKNEALFRVAKLYYEHKKDIQTALQKANEIQYPDEKARCLVHLADAVIANEGDLDLADKIIGQIGEDRQGYIKYYEKVKREYIENHK